MLDMYVYLHGYFWPKNPNVSYVKNARLPTYISEQTKNL